MAPIFAEPEAVAGNDARNLESELFLKALGSGTEAPSAGAAGRRGFLFQEKAPPRWQWEHRTGFRDYTPEESKDIEQQFREGKWMARMKVGKGHTMKPRQIFFYDMMQLDLASGGLRSIRRVPEMNRLQRLGWRLGTMLAGFLRGDRKWWKSKGKRDFDKARDMMSHRVRDPTAEMLDLDSFAGKMVTSWCFNFISIAVIVFNGIYIWVDADYNPGLSWLDTPAEFIFFDNFFCVWFLLEAIARISALRSRKYVCSDRWLLMDIVICVLMILDTWIMNAIAYCVNGESPTNLDKLSIFRFVRFARLARITRLFKVFPQMFVLLKGIFMALQGLFYVLLLLFVLTYSFAIMFAYTSVLSEKMQELGYNRVWTGCWNLMIYGTFLDSVGQMLDGMKEAGMEYALAFLVFIFVSSLMMLNMLIGILCETLSRVTAQAHAKLEEQAIEQAVMEWLECYDRDEDRCLCKNEFEQLMSDPDFASILEEHAIDVDALAKFTDVFFTQRLTLTGTTTYSTLSFDTFLDKVLQLRGGNTATMSDMADLRTWLNRRFAELGEYIEGSAVCSTSLQVVRNPHRTTTDGGQVASLLSKQLLASPSKTMLPEQLPSSGRSSRTCTAANNSADFQESVLTTLATIRAGQRAIDMEVTKIKQQLLNIQIKADPAQLR